MNMKKGDNLSQSQHGSQITLLRIRSPLAQFQVNERAKILRSSEFLEVMKIGLDRQSELSGIIRMKKMTSF